MFQFRNFVLIPTNICNLRCRHCYPTSGSSREDVHRYGSNKIMSPEQAERYIQQVPDLPNVYPLLHLGGGESTLFPKEFKAIVSLGKKYGFKVSMVSNCSWAKDQAAADDFAADLDARGMKRIEISLSVFHQEFLDVAFAVRAIRACKKFGWEIVLRPTIIKSATIAKALEGISEEDLRGVAVGISKCMPVGRAKDEISKNEFHYQNISYGACKRILNLTIRQDGSVFPCCAGADVTRSLCMGNAEKESLKDILERAQLDPLFVVLIQQGPRYLAELLREAGGKDFLSDPHVNICHLCNDLFIDDKIADSVRQALNRRLQKTILTDLEKASILL